MRRPFACALLLAGCGSSAGPKSPGPVVVVIGGDAGPSPIAVADNGDAGAGDAATEGQAREDRLVAAMMKRVSEVRKLAALRAVPGVVLPRERLLEKVKNHLEREVPPDAIQHEGLELQLLGFVPATFDYLAETFKLLNAQLAGFYEPEDGTMYMAADLDGTNAEATLAHELDHALQDQHFDLKSHSKYVAGKSDEQAAYDGLAEGDATSTMADVIIGKTMSGKTVLDLPDEAFAEQVLEGVSAGDAANVPHVMRTSLVAPYVYGTMFVNALRRGGGWGAVDAAWGALPVTTEQLLHVQKWRAHEPPLDVAAPTFAALGSGWTAVDEDSSGELGLRLAFEEWIGSDKARAAAEGWGGDRDVLVQNGDRAAIALHIRYDAKRAATPSDEPFTLLAAGLPGSVGKPVAKDASWICIERPHLGPLAVMKRDHDLVVVAGPAKNVGATWGAAGDCTLAKKWAKEIAVEK
jgi:hypothetical protein